MEIVIRVTVVYLFIMVALRVLGKREFGELSPLELICLLLVPEIVSQAIQGESHSVTNGFIGIATLFTLVFLTSLFMHRFKTGEEIVAGIPTVLAHRGRLFPAILNRERVTPEELYAAPTVDFVNVPLLALPFVPLSALPERTARVVFGVVGMAALGLAAVWFFRSAKLDPWGRAAAMLLLVLNGPLHYSVALGNLSHVLLPVLLAAFTAGRAGREARAGTLAGNGTISAAGGVRAEDELVLQGGSLANPLDISQSLTGNADVEVRSGAGQGTTFTLTLPAASA